MKVTSEFKYLGGLLSCVCSLEYEVNYRITQGDQAYGQFRARVFENHICLKTKVSVYCAVSLSALLYGSEASVLEAFHIRFLQHMLGISGRDKVPLIIILQRAQALAQCAMPAPMDWPRDMHERLAVA